MADPKQKGRIPDEAKLGFAFLLAIIVFVYGLFFLKEIRVTGGTYMIRAEFGNIGGVKRSDPVLIGGVQIGKVERTGLDNRQPYAILRIEDEYRIPDDSAIEVFSRSVMGEMGLQVRLGQSTTMVPPDGVLRGKEATGLSTLLSDADSLSARLQTLLANADRYLDPNSETSFRRNLNSLQDLTDTFTTTLRQERQQIHRVMVDLDSLVNTVRGISNNEREKIAATMSHLEQTSAQLVDMTARLQRSTGLLETILLRLERGEGTLGKLLIDDKLYKDMDRLMVNLDGLIADLKENPKRYFGVSIF